MRVLMVSNIFSSKANPHGGSFISSRVSALRAIGVAVDTVGVGVIPRGRGDLRPDWMLDGTVSVSDVQRLRIRTQGRVAKLEVEAARRIAELIDLEGVDAVMAHGMFAPAAGVVAGKIAAMAEVPYSIHLHGSDVNALLPRNPQHFLGALDSSTVNIFVSHALLHRAQVQGYVGQNHQVIPNGIDPRIFGMDITRQNRPSPEQSAFLFVGNLLPVKGADRLPNIFKEILRAIPDAKFVVIGDGPLRRELERATQDLPVKYHGRVGIESVAHCMSMASILMLPSRSEGWPTVINEAYAVGTPVVAADVGGVSEAIHDKRFLVKDGDDFDRRYARRVVEVVGSSNAYQLARRARSFTWESLVKRELRALGLGSFAE